MFDSFLLFRVQVQKYIDFETNETYYLNPRTNVKSVKKPLILGELDVYRTIRLPRKGLEYKLICNNCKKENATVSCNECEFSYCTPCTEKTHGSGNKASHLRTPIIMCIECDYQVATRECLQCQDRYCDTCFPEMHRKGMLIDHEWKALVSMCSVCSNYAAKYCCRDYECSGYTYCDSCWHGWHVEGRRRHQKIDIPYVSEDMKLKERLALEAKMKEEQDRLDKEEAERILHARKIRYAIKIQRVWRGKKERKIYKPELDARLAQKLAMKKQREEDDKIRATRNYQMLLALGRAPILKSDTEEEKLKARRNILTRGVLGGIEVSKAVGIVAAKSGANLIEGIKGHDAGYEALKGTANVVNGKSFVTCSEAQTEVRVDIPI